MIFTKRAGLHRGFRCSRARLHVCRSHLSKWRQLWLAAAKTVYAACYQRSMDKAMHCDLQSTRLEHAVWVRPKCLSVSQGRHGLWDRPVGGRAWCDGCLTPVSEACASQGSGLQPSTAMHSRQSGVGETCLRSSHTRFKGGGKGRFVDGKRCRMGGADGQGRAEDPLLDTCQNCEQRRLCSMRLGSVKKKVRF